MSRRFATQPSTLGSSDRSVTITSNQRHVPSRWRRRVSSRVPTRCRGAPGDRANARHVDIVRVHEVDAVHADRFRRGIAEDRLERRAHVADESVGADHHDDVGLRAARARGSAARSAAAPTRSGAAPPRRLRSPLRARSKSLIVNDDAERGEDREAVHEWLRRPASARCRARSRARPMPNATKLSTIAGVDGATPREADALDDAEDQPDRERRPPTDGVHHRGDAEHVHRRRGPTAQPSWRVASQSASPPRCRNEPDDSSAHSNQIGVGAISDSRPRAQNTGTTTGSVSTRRVDQPGPGAGPEGSRRGAHGPSPLSTRSVGRAP